jgi:serine/threonine protein kinase
MLFWENFVYRKKSRNTHKKIFTRYSFILFSRVIKKKLILMDSVELYFPDVKSSQVILDLKREGVKLQILDKELGSGSYATVYLGILEKEKETKQYVAVKRINLLGIKSSETKLITREIENLQLVNHKNLVNLLDKFQENQSKYYICLELCVLGNLSDYLKKKKEMNEELALKISGDLIDGYRELHQKNLIHRDIKPENILVDNNENFKIADFGFSKYIDEYDAVQLKSFRGTPYYASLEILREDPYTSKCDVFSMGVVFFNILYSRHPFFPQEQPKTLKNLHDKYTKSPAE